MSPASQQVAGGAHLGRVDVSHRKRAAAQQHRNLVGIDLVVLRLSAMDGFHVEGMAEDEFDTFLAAQVGKPVPGEHAFHADHQVVAECMFVRRKASGELAMLRCRSTFPSASRMQRNIFRA